MSRYLELEDKTWMLYKACALVSITTVLVEAQVSESS